MRDIEKDLMNKYGPLLSTKDLAEVFKYKDRRCVVDAISRGMFPCVESPLETIKRGKQRFARCETVAAYIEDQFPATP